MALGTPPTPKEILESMEDALKEIQNELNINSMHYTGLLNRQDMSIVKYLEFSEPSNLAIKIKLTSADSTYRILDVFSSTSLLQYPNLLDKRNNSFSKIQDLREALLTIQKKAQEQQSEKKSTTTAFTNASQSQNSPNAKSQTAASEQKSDAKNTGEGSSSTHKDSNKPG